MNDISKLIKGNVPATVPARAPTKVESKADSKAKDKSEFYKRSRAPLNVIPSPEQLHQLVSKALEALSKGVYWDRGSIVNLVL